MAFWETKVYDKNQNLIGYTEYNNTIDMFSIPIFKTKDLLDLWWNKELNINNDDCIIPIEVYLECSHGKLKRIVEWNKDLNYGYIKSQPEVISKEWIKI